MHSRQFAKTRPCPVGVPDKVHARHARWEDIDDRDSDKFVVDFVHYDFSLELSRPKRWVGTDKDDRIHSFPVDQADYCGIVLADSGLQSVIC